MQAYNIPSRKYLLLYEYFGKENRVMKVLRRRRKTDVRYFHAAVSA